MTGPAYLNDEIDLRQYAAVVAKRWKSILLVTLLLAILALVYSLRQKPVYEARTTLLLRSGGSAGGMSQYSGLANMLGMNLGGSGSSGNLGDLTELLKSQAVAAKVLDDLRLDKRIKGWDVPGLSRQNLASAVSGFLKPPRTTGNIIELKVVADDAQLAADVANGFVNAISYYWNELNYTEAQKKLKYIEAELPRVESDLKIVERKLKLSSPASSGVDLSIGGNQSGMQRDYEIYNSVYITLRKEYESAKLETSKEIPPFSVVDKAEKPLTASGPKTKTNVLIGLALGLFLGLFLAFFQEYWEQSARRS
jgi:uncharacterized protein involved in exopolysaccharide biosynthesis